MRNLLLLTGCFLWSWQAAFAHADSPTAFFEQHCVDCHSGEDAEGNLDLTELNLSFANLSDVRRWTLILDRVAAGEMPPEEYGRPEPGEIQTWIGLVKPRVIEADQQLQEVVLRRLNRREYEQTVHDLLSIDIPLASYLPDDQLAAGFDTNGAALAVSTEQLEAYMKAAEVAINVAIVTGKQPETQTAAVDSFREIKPYVGKNYDIVDGRAAVFNSSRGVYSKISTRDFRVRQRGRYRFSFEVAAVNTDRPMALLADADGTEFYLDAPPNAQRVTREAILNPGSAVQFHLLDRPTFVRDPVVNKEPGVSVGPVTITGPIYDSWPPVSHVNLIGDVDLAHATPTDARKILAKFLPRAFRRSVFPEEIDRYTSLVYDRIQAGRDVEDALKIALTAVLCSPNFLYLGEDHREPKANLSDIALANRLSYFLWGSMPDEILFRRALDGELSSSKALQDELDRMLADSKSERFIHSFTDHWLHLRRIDETSPDRKLFQDFDPFLKYSMVEESRAFFRRVLAEDRSIFEFLDSDYAMLNERLARHYQVDGVVGTKIRPVPLPDDSVRGGVLAQAAILKVTANGTNTSPVVRGVWVLENILGQHLPPPPADIPALEPDLRGATTVRERLEKHRADESCRSCHRSIDPPGFALESFDPVGGFRTNYIRFQVNPKFVEQGWGSFVNGAEVDSSGITTRGESFDDINGFRKLLLKHRKDFARCLIEKLFTYGLGRELGISDREEVERIAAEAVDKDCGLKTLLRMIVSSPIFQRS